MTRLAPRPREKAFHTRPNAPRTLTRALSARGARQTCSFAYDAAWLGLAGAFPLDSNLPLVRGDAHWDGGLFNAFSDPAPDRWGRNLMARRERHQAKAEGRAPRTLLEADFLMLVEDQTRLGALRFRDLGGEAYQAADAHPVPPLVALPKLLGAARRVIDDKETDEELRLLLAPGSSLGGAQPKASVQGAQGELLIAMSPADETLGPWLACCCISSLHSLL